jgi:hypothetical protein
MALGGGFQDDDHDPALKSQKPRRQPQTEDEWKGPLGGGFQDDGDGSLEGILRDEEECRRLG